MSDIFGEVDEEVRREQLAKLWERYGNLITIVVVLFVVAIAGWKGYQYWEAKQAAEAGGQFNNAVALSEQGKTADAEAAFAKIATTGTAGYRNLARLREAAELAQRDPKIGVEAYDKLAADGSLGPVLQDLAALRAGMLVVDSAPFDELRKRLEPLAAPDRTFRHTARELLVLAAWRAGDAVSAKRFADMMLTDSETPAATRGRVEVLMSLLAADGKS